MSPVPKDGVHDSETAPDRAQLVYTTRERSTNLAASTGVICRECDDCSIAPPISDAAEFTGSLPPSPSPFPVLQQVYTTEWCRPRVSPPLGVRCRVSSKTPPSPLPLSPGGALPTGGTCDHGQRRSNGRQEEGRRRDGCSAAHRP